MKKKYKVAGINFDHMHMGDLLRMVWEHPDAEIVGICDETPARMESAARNFALPSEAVFTDYRECLERGRPDLVILCPATAGHAEWTEKVAPYGVDVLVEKPFAATLAEADRMIRAMEQSHRRLAINWPLRWYPAHATAYRLVSEGRIGELAEVHYYDGNRGPLWHAADKVETVPTPEEKAGSWFYRKAAGGGSLLDYLGYGVTLGAWFHGGRKPIEVTSVTDASPGLEVDEHSITVARYACGLSKFETRWGTFTDPWTEQPQPKCGFVLVGTKGTLSSYDFESSVRIQTEDCPQGRELPVDQPAPPYENPVQYVLDCLDTGREIEGPLSPAISRIGQEIVDAAVLSAAEKRTVSLEKQAESGE
ncbi:MAG: Gfo/Idh/MocA family oxidoreductase [Opitutales bacterium]